MPMISAQDSMAEAIKEAIEAKAEWLKEAAISAAVVQFENDLRDCIGRTVLGVSRHYAIEQNRDNLVITVRIGDGR